MAPRNWRVPLLFAGLALASAALELSSPAEVIRFPGNPTRVFDHLAEAILSSDDFNMLANWAASVKGNERLLDPESPYTVFAPRNVAFERIPRDVLNEIWIPGNRLWPRLFWHHIVTGNFRELKDGDRLAALDGGALRVSVKDGSVAVEGVPIIGRLVTWSSVVYVIDTLLVPADAPELQRFLSLSSASTASAEVKALERQ